MVADLCLDTSGTYLYIVEYTGCRVRRLQISSNNVTTVAGATGSSPTCSYATGTGTSTRFNKPSSCVVREGPLFDRLAC